jgi:V/A-type H+-transporting ATPase subunit D
MLQQIKPTRMELLKLRRRIALAKKGHHLLKEKRDALFSEFYKQLKDAQELRKDVEKLLERAYFMLAIANAQFSSLKVAEFAFASSSMHSKVNAELAERNIMGARVPILSAQNIKRTILERGYSITDSGSAVDESAGLFEQALEKIVKLAEKEATLEKLAFEISKTKRKVNSLEKVVIPKMESLQHYIEFRLEEREREGIFTLKKVKKKIEQKALSR